MFTALTLTLALQVAALVALIRLTRPRPKKMHSASSLVAGDVVQVRGLCYNDQYVVTSNADGWIGTTVGAWFSTSAVNDAIERGLVTVTLVSNSLPAPTDA